MRNLLRALHNNQAGQDLVEYALILFLVALGATAGMGNLAIGIQAATENVGAQVAVYLNVGGSNSGNGHGNHGAGSGNGNNGNHYGNGNGNGLGNGG